MSQRSNTIKAAGLYTFLSELQAPEGSLVKADNVNIDEMGVITPRRGFGDYGEELSDTSQTVKQLLEYKNRILRHYNGKLEFDDGNGVFTPFLETIQEVEPGLRIKSKQVNSNLYFTTNDGIKKLSASKQSDLSNINIDNAGVPKAVDISAKVSPSTIGFLPPRSKVGYKILYGYKDLNNVLVLGAPTSIFVVTNSEEESVIPEQFSITFQDNLTGSDFVDGLNNVSGGSGGTGKYFTLSTKDIDYYIWYSISDLIDGLQTENPEDSETFGKIAIQVGIKEDDTQDKIAAKTANVLNSELSSQYEVTFVGNAITLKSKEKGDIVDAGLGTLSTNEILIENIQQGNLISGKEVNCEISTIIPNNIDKNKLPYFIQIYRTQFITATEDQSLNDISPGEECNLVHEEAVQLEPGEIYTHIDDVTEDFRDRGTPLYNNPFSGEGLLQSNEIPPIAKDIENFNNYTFYANTKTFHRSQFRFVSVDDFKNEETAIYIGNEDTLRQYTFRGVQEQVEIKCGTKADTIEAVIEKNELEFRDINETDISNPYLPVESTDQNFAFLELYSRENKNKHHLWYDIGNGFDPASIEQEITQVKENSTDDKLEKDSHGLLDGNIIEYNNLEYFVVNSTVDDFQLSETEDGNPIEIQSDNTVNIVKREISKESIGIRVDINTNNTRTEILQSTVTKLNEFPDFNTEVYNSVEGVFGKASTNTFSKLPDTIENVQENSTDNKLEKIRHGLLNNDIVVYNSQQYFVINSSQNDFQISLTKNGNFESILSDNLISITKINPHKLLQGNILSYTNPEGITKLGSVIVISNDEFQLSEVNVGSTIEIGTSLENAIQNPFDDKLEKNNHELNNGQSVEYNGTDYTVKNVTTNTFQLEDESNNIVQIDGTVLNIDSVNINTEVFTEINHGLVNGTKVRYINRSGKVIGDYFVINSNTNDFQISLSEGGGVAQIEQSLQVQENSSSNTLELADHGLANGEKVIYNTVEYFVIQANADSFKISTNGTTEYDITTDDLVTIETYDPTPIIYTLNEINLSVNDLSVNLPISNPFIMSIKNSRAGDSTGIVSKNQDQIQINNIQDGKSAYINLYSAEDKVHYYLWFNKGNDIDPLVDQAVGIEVDLSNELILDTENVALYLRNVILNNLDFTTNLTIDNQGVIVTNTENGDSTDANTISGDASIDIGTGWSISINQQGLGEDSDLQFCKWSINPSLALSIEETARSFVKIVNRDISSPVNAFYLSGEEDVPGLILLENRNLEDKPFYIGVGNIGTIGKDISNEFDPALPFVNSKNTLKLENNISLGFGYFIEINSTTNQINVIDIPGDITNIEFSNKFLSFDELDDFDNLVNRYTLIIDQEISKTYDSVLGTSEITLSYTEIIPSITGIVTIETGVDFLQTLNDNDVQVINNELQITSSNHGLATGDEIYFLITGNSGNDPDQILGNFTVNNVIDANIFTIPVSENLNIKHTKATLLYFYKTDQASENEEKPNRIYYSKLLQPEAVPIGNFLDVGSRDFPIERIIALRDTLFVLKTDGVYMLTGFGAPFSVRILDNTSKIIAPDSAVVLNNQIFCLTDDGVASITESGISIISRPIEDKILNVTGQDFDYRLSTFAVSYDNDKAYILWLPLTSEDTVSKQAYRYNYYERTWTRWTVSATSGVVSNNSILYLGDGERPYTLKQRKSRSRLDFADINFTLQIPPDSVIGETTIRLSNFSRVEVGDVLVQEQYVTIDVYNNLLLKLDLDPLVVPDQNENYEAIKSVPGDNISTKLNQLEQKLISDGINVSDRTWIPSAQDLETSTFAEYIRDEFNAFIDELNNENSGTQYKTYSKANQLIQYESIVDSKNTTRPDLNRISVLVPHRFFEGDIEVYKAIKTEIQWNPLHFGDPSAQKQFSKGTVIVDQNNFTKATVSYSSDVSQGFVDIEKQGKGVGYFSSGNYGDSNLYWGGDGNDVPLLNIIPREKQRGRYLNVKFQHAVAREGFRILGVTTVVRAVSDRGYR